MKFGNVGAINPGETSNLPLGGDDFLSRVNLTINNFKELLLAFQQVRGLPGAAGEPQSQAVKTNPVNRPGLDKNAVIGFLENLEAKGFGAITIQQIIQQYGGLSMKQIGEILKNA